MKIKLYMLLENKAQTIEIKAPDFPIENQTDRNDFIEAVSDSLRQLFKLFYLEWHHSLEIMTDSEWKREHFFEYMDEVPEESNEDEDL